MSINFDRLREVFQAAVEQHPASQWDAYLDEACAGDAELHQQAALLLKAHAEGGSLVNAPLPDKDRTGLYQPVTERPGTVIGPYKLLQQIGEGGMGVVWMAEQTQPVQRKVALKVIKPGMDSRQVIARFEAERQALALMDHVNIARVFDGGTTGFVVPPLGGSAEPEDRLKAGLQTGRPYFVMELVHGVPITKYCDDNHLTPRERLELFVPVCQAIQHAHQKGIIHRDIKPSNVMITHYDGKPVPKVIDFGVAKATEQKLTERTLFTQYGTMVGTLEYMSPEQAEMSALGVDTRSDIYSLGVLLYELLTGSTPLTHKRMKEAVYAEILRMIKEEEPPKPSTRLSDSGEALASISANRHTEPAKLTKLVRGELDWIVMKSLEKDRNRRYETANGFAQDVQRYLADEPVLACPPSVGYRFGKFARRNRVTLAFTGLMLLILLAVTGGIGWNVRDRAARQAAIELEVNLALKEAEHLQEQAKWPEALSAAKRAEGLLAGSGGDELRDRVRQLRKDLEMVLRLEEISVLRSEIHEHKFAYESADRAYAKAFADYGIDVAGLPLAEAAARIRGRTGVVVALVAALDDWALSRFQMDRAGSSALKELAQAVDRDPWRRQVREAAKQNDRKSLVALATSPDLVRQPPTSLLRLARALRAHGLAEAEIKVLRQAQRQYPGDFWINYNLCYALWNLGHPYRDEAVSFARAALAARPHSSAAHNSLGVALKQQGQLDDAIAAYKEAVELDPKYANAHKNLGHALRRQNKPDEAIACYKKAIELDAKDAKAHNSLGAVLVDQNKLDDAIASFKEAIELDPKDVYAHVNLGIALRRQKKLDDAIASFKKGIELDPKDAPAHHGLGVAFKQKGQLDDAIAEYKAALELDPKYALAHVNLGNALRQQNKLDDAIASFKKGIELDAKDARAHNSLGAALMDQNKLDDAIASFKKAIKIDPRYASAYHNNLGMAMKKQGNIEEAIANYSKAIKLDPKNAKAHIGLGAILCDVKHDYDGAVAAFRTAIELEPKSATAHYNLGCALERQKKLDEAIDYHRKAVKLDPKSAYVRNGLVTALAKTGWDLVNRPDPKLRDPKRAVALAKEALQLAPRSVSAWQYWGWIQYRTGNWKDSVEALEKSCKLQEGGDDGQWIVLALAHTKLAAQEGLSDKEREHHKAEARRRYEQADELIDKKWPVRPDNGQSIWDFRVEARKLMGVKEIKK